MFDQNKIGLFRANPLANRENSLKLEAGEGTGTPQVDTGTVDVSAASSIEGIKYTGKDGVNAFIPFTNEDQLTQKRTPFTISAQAEAKTIQDDIHAIVALHEVDSIVSVTKSANTLTVSHTGAGTITAIVVDGADVALSRANIAVVSTGGVKATKTKAKK